MDLILIQVKEAVILGIIKWNISSARRIKNEYYVDIDLKQIATTDVVLGNIHYQKKNRKSIFSPRIYLHITLSVLCYILYIVRIYFLQETARNAFRHQIDPGIQQQKCLT